MKYVSEVIIIIAIVFVIYKITTLPYDDTDFGDERSGLSLFTDNLTGCQYLKAGLFGGITPRLYSDGSQVGCR